MIGEVLVGRSIRSMTFTAGVISSIVSGAGVTFGSCVYSLIWTIALDVSFELITLFVYNSHISLCFVCLHYLSLSNPSANPDKFER